MPDALVLRPIELAQVSLRFPVLFDLLMRTMTIQPELDPQAGLGAYTVPTLFLQSAFDVLTESRILEKCGYNPYKLYVLVRVMHYKYFSKEEWDQELLKDGEFSFDEMLSYLVQFVNQFNTSLAFENFDNDIGGKI